MAEQVTGRGARAVVCAAAPLAAQAGAAVLREGGNAYDAAVAAALAETVLLPPKCGLGGDLIAIVLEPGATEPEALLAIGGAPAGLAAVASAAAELPAGDPAGWSDTGPSSVGPPAAAAGYLALAARGALPLDRLAAAARSLAVDGFPWAEVCTRLQLASRALVAQWNPEGTVYFPGGEVIGPGTITRLPGLAAVLDELVTRGEGFLHGPVGEAIAATVARHGGVLTAADFAFARAEWTACASGALGQRTVWATPAPTHGPSLLEAVAAAAPGDDSAAQYRRVLAAIARRRDTLADPSGTSMVSATDADGRVVVVVHSNSFPRFGSGLVVPGFDLVLANRAGRGFTALPGHPNFPVAGRRPATTLHAWMVSDAAGRPELAGATPGGANLMPWNALLLQGILDGITAPGRLVTAPRWEWLPADDGVRVEGGLAAADGLAAAAPRVVPTGRWAMTSAQQVVRVHRPGQPLEGAADPRTVGLALGI